MTEAAALTPVNLITGFLGSGKTTLLQRLLRDPALSDTAVLINEFGEVGLDHHLLERIDETMVLLQSGCLCCTIRGELSSAIKDLHARRDGGRIPFFRRLVIESTGLADPFPILSTVQADPVLKHHFRLGNVIATVGGHRIVAECKKGPLLRKPGSLAYTLLTTALGQALLFEVSADDIVVAAVPDTPVFRKLAEIWRSRPLVRRAGIRIALVARDGAVSGLDL